MANAYSVCFLASLAPRLLGLWLTRNSRTNATKTASLLSRAMVVVWVIASARECTKRHTSPPPLFGLACACVGNALLMGSHLSLANCWSVHNTIRTDHALVESGLYRWIRHPMYLSFFCLWCAYVSLSRNPVIAVSFAVPLIECILRIPAEERALMESIPQYRDYIKRSRRLVPFVW